MNTINTNLFTFWFSRVYRSYVAFTSYFIMEKPEFNSRQTLITALLLHAIKDKELQPTHL